MTTAEARGLAIALITESIHRHALGVPGSAPDSEWLAAAAVLGPLLDVFTTGGETARLVAIYLADMAAVTLEELAKRARQDPLDVLRRFALGPESGTVT